MTCYHTKSRLSHSVRICNTEASVERIMDRASTILTNTRSIHAGVRVCHRTIYYVEASSSHLRAANWTRGGSWVLYPKKLAHTAFFNWRWTLRNLGVILITEYQENCTIWSLLILGNRCSHSQRTSWIFFPKMNTSVNVNLRGKCLTHLAYRIVRVSLAWASGLSIRAMKYNSLRGATWFPVYGSTSLSHT